MSNLKNIQRKLCEGVAGWLLFEFNCERGLMFNEKYLSYPIGQILNSVTIYKARAEKNHPCGNEGGGRPLQVDFVLMNDQEEWKYAFESKWVGNSSISLGSIIWDIVRLQNLFYHHTDLKCYFILAGFEKKIKSLISTFDVTYNPNSNKQSSITTVNSTFLILDLFRLDSKTKKYLNNLVTKYPKILLHSKIRCRPAHKFPKKDIINMSFSTYTFEILAPDKTLRITSL